MPVLEDFTGLSVGQEAAGEGFVERCPRCGRSGLAEKIDGHTLYLHAQTTEMMSDGLLVTLEDCCGDD